MFDPNTPIPVETHLQKLKELDDITVKTVSTESISCILHFTRLPLLFVELNRNHLLQILLVLRNLENNLSAPQFEPVVRFKKRFLTPPHVS